MSPRHWSRGSTFVGSRGEPLDPAPRLTSLHEARGPRGGVVLQSPDTPLGCGESPLRPGEKPEHPPRFGRPAACAQRAPALRPAAGPASSYAAARSRTAALLTEGSV